MFSPIGVKRQMLQNFQRAQQLGVEVEEVTRANPFDKESFIRSQSRLGSFESFSGEDKDDETRPARKRRPKKKKYLTQNELHNKFKKDDGVLGRAVRKLTTAAVKFRKDRDGALLQCFETRSLNYEEFRLMLKKVFRLEFTDEEYEAAFNLFDTDKSRDIDGTEFLVYFTHLATIWKEDHKASLMQKIAEYHKNEAMEEAKKEAAIKAYYDQSVDYDYSEEDERSAMEKLQAGAKLYRKGHPSAKSIDGFEVAYLDPFTFRNLVFQTFDIKLTPKEVGVLVHMYDNDNNGMVCSPWFMVQFLKMGNERRLEDWSKQVELTRSASKAIEDEKVRKLEAQQAALEKGLDFDFTEEDQKTAIEKLRVAAVKFDKNHPSSLSLDGFAATYTTPGVFREMLKRTFNLILPSKELGALVKFFDTDNCGKVNNHEFLTYFSRASTGGKFAMRSYMIERQRKAIADAEAAHQRMLQEQWGKLEDRVKYEFSEEDKRSAIEKITDLARKYFNDKASNIGLKAFTSATMGPAVWREMMKRAFAVTITDGELAYFISLYGDKDRNIDCIDFNLKFKALVFECRSKARTHQLKLNADEEMKKKEAAEAKLMAARHKNEKSVSYDYSEEDIESALSKFRHAAMKHDKHHPAAVSLEAFDVSTMSAMDFQEVCRRVFHFELTPKELGVMVTLTNGGLKRLHEPIPGGSIEGSQTSVSVASLGSRATTAAKSTLSNSSGRKSRGNASIDGFGPTDSLVNCNEFSLIFTQLQRIEKSSIRSTRVELEQQLKQNRLAELQKTIEDNKRHLEHLIRFTNNDCVSLMQKLNKAAQLFAIDK